MRSDENMFAVPMSCTPSTMVTIAYRKAQTRSAQPKAPGRRRAAGVRFIAAAYE